MGRVVVSEYVTLDGIMEAPNTWSFQFWSEQAAQFKLEELLAADALLLGRVTYQGFASAWPSMTDEAGFADRMNGLPKFVASTTLTDLGWTNSTPIAGDIAGEVRGLKDRFGQDILVAGSADLVRTLMHHKLVDEYRLMVHPIVVGRGKRLFGEGVGMSGLALVGTQTLGSGVVVLSYRPVRQGASSSMPS